MGQTAAPLATQSLNLRIRPQDRALFDRAALARGVNRTQFVLDSARRAAAQAVLDQTVFECDEDTFERFVARLDAPPAPSAGLHATLSRPAPWE